MRKYLLPEEGNFYKTALHCHSTVSDGKLTPAELKAEFKKKGYSAVAFTDHELIVPHPELEDEDFLPSPAMRLLPTRRDSIGLIPRPITSMFISETRIPLSARRFAPQRLPIKSICSL